jgi:hypothetical protein
MLFYGGTMKPKQQDTYKETRTFIINGHTVRVRIPDISEDERARRLKEVEKAAAQLLREKQTERK